ncbi:MAG: ATP-dependent helicase RecQ [Actinomycetota bacterium]|jgi:ATP-dependent DNA helicase RecQ
MTDSGDLARLHLGDVLHRLAGPSAEPRGDQVDAVAAILQPAARVLVVQATGWGKSAVYWAATAALRSGGAGPSLVVSPLLALMRNQVDAATSAGLRAFTVNSTNFDEWDTVFEALARDDVDVLLVSPERLGNPRFAARLPELLERVGLVVVDEAHCISDWGFDFRPDYQRLARALLATPRAAVLATTATANERVTADIARQLGPSAVTLRGTLARTSLRLGVVPGLSAVHRYAWVADALEAIEGSGIVYVLTVAEADRLAAFLCERGFRVPAYTGALDALERVRIEEQLRTNSVKAVVATSALGMGYDKPDLAFCFHVGSPSTPVAYYQQVGRAGRAVARADAVLLPGPGDEAIWEYFATASIPDPSAVQSVLASLDSGPQSVVELEAATGLRRGRLDALLKILAVDDVVGKDGTKWASTGVPYAHDHAKWADLAEVRRSEADLMRRYARGEGCLMAYLQTALDDPDPAPCGRCSVCTGDLPHPGATPSAANVDAARSFLRGADTVVEARKRWPSGAARRGAIVGLADGRAVAFADDPGWVAEITALQRSRYADIPGELLDGAVASLGRWRSTWIGRPVAMVPVPAHGAEADANRRLAEHLAGRGGLPVLDAFSWQGGPPPADASSTAVVAHLERAIRLDPTASFPDGPVLLCAASARTRWTLTVAAAMLHEAGCGVAMPLVLHLRP